MKPQLKKIDNFYSGIKSILDKARELSFRAVNFLMVEAYWNIGRMIFEEEQKGKIRADYGSFLIALLSKRLTKDFGKGFDERNLWYMVQFYNAFPILNALRSESDKKTNGDALRHKSVNKKNIIFPVVRGEFLELKDVLRTELSWTHYRLLLKLEKEEARQFYMNEAANNNWSTRELERQISSLLFERLSLSKDKKSVNRMSRKGQIIKTPEDLVKDPYVLEFLGLEKMEKYYESDLEKALITHLQKFLLELGRGFSFVARQQRITLDGDHFYIDLVFYNRLTRSFVLIDLKVGKLTHGDIGQMQMYVNYYNRTQKNKGENITIGLLLCAEKNDTVVKYTLPESQKQIFVSKYLPYLPTEEELKNEIKKEKQNLQIHLKLRGTSE
jgi:predicted nuclease of restriction endonuclease-like (RecB) superfamily